MVEQVLEKLETNKNLDKIVIEQLKELILNFCNNLPAVDLTQLYERIGNLKIVAGNKYIDKDAAQYYVNENEIRFNTYEVSKDYDLRNVMMQQLLDIATKKSNVDDDFKTIRTGYRSIVANNCVGNDADKNPYFIKETIVNLMGCIVGQKVLEDCYFKDDYSTLVTELTKIYNKPEEISQLLNQTKHDKYVEENLGSIEKKLVDIFMSKNNLVQEDITNFKTALIGNSAIFEDEKEQYKSVDGLYQYFDQKLAEKTNQIPLLPHEELGRSR